MLIMPDTSPGPSKRRRRRLASTALATATLLLAPAAAHAAEWADGPAFAGGPTAMGSHLAIGPDGSATQTWIDAAFSGPEAPDLTQPAHLKVQRAASDGSVGPAVDVATFLPVGGTLDADVLFSPTAVATGAGGTTAVAWLTPVGSGDTAEVDLAFLGADGGVANRVRVAEFASTGGPGNPGLSLAVDGAGTATVAFDSVDTDDRTTGVTVARVSPGVTPRTTFLATDQYVSPSVAAAPGGVAWVAWGAPTGSRVARFAADGRLYAAPQSFGVATVGASLTAAANGAAVAVSDPTTYSVVGARLAPTGDLIASRFETAALTTPPLLLPFMPALALGPDGTVTVARTVIFSQTSGEVDYTRIPAGASTASAQQVTGSASTVPVLPALAAAADGTVLIAWANVTPESISQTPDPASPPSPIQTRTVAPDGALGPIMDAGSAGYIFNVNGQNTISTGIVPLLMPDGSASLGLPQGYALGSVPPGQAPIALGVYKLRTFDVTPPAVDVSVPASALVGTQVSFAATTAEHGVTLSWDFGDGSGASGATVKHAYGVVGTYAVRLTATDAVGNAAVLTRQLTITAPVVATVPPPPAPPVRAARRAAALKIARATRSGASVTVSGTIAASAGGSVTIAYAQRSGRTTLTFRKTASIRRGRWTATLRLPARVARAGGRATVTVAYRGDADTLKTTARKVVTRAKPKPRKARRPTKGKPKSRRG